MNGYSVICGDVTKLPLNGQRFHAILCDAPYETEFMGKRWDATGVAFQSDTWKHIASHMHDGAFGMAFGGSRTYHRLACAIEDAGLIMHPAIGWLQGQGFAKATKIDRQLQKRRHGWNGHGMGGTQKPAIGNQAMLETSLEERLAIWQVERKWPAHRYGLQAMKPALEFVCVFQKPYVGCPVDCITGTGAGVLNIDGGRISSGLSYKAKCESVVGLDSNRHGNCYGEWTGERESSWTPSGRWPPNFALVCSTLCEGDKHHESCPVRLLDEQAGERKSAGQYKQELMEEQPGWEAGMFGVTGRHNDYAGQRGGPSRFFHRASWELEQASVRYVPKASRKERDTGLEAMPEQVSREWRTGNAPPNVSHRVPDKRCRNPHPTVKPIALTRWLATLLLPPEEYAPRRILVPFSGSGSEAAGAVLAGWDEVVAVDNEEDYNRIALARLAYWAKQPEQMQLV